MAPSAVEAPEVSSEILSKKLDRFDLNITGLTPEMELHDLATGSSGLLDSSSFRSFHGSKKSHIRASSPTGSIRSTYTTRRHGSRRFSGGFMRTSRHEFSNEVTSQAEAEFSALMELMAGMSRRSLSLKEVWTKLVSHQKIPLQIIGWERSCWDLPGKQSADTK